MAFLWSHLLLLLGYLLKYQAQLQVKKTDFVRNNEETEKRKNRYSPILLLPRNKFSRIEKLLSGGILDAEIRRACIS